MTISDPIPLPFDEGQWIRVRALTGEEYEAAQTAHRIEFVNGDKWAGLFKTFIEKGPSTASVKKALADPLTGFNRYVLARSGLVAWSYPQSIKRIEPVPAVAATDTTPAQAEVVAVDAIKDLRDDPLEFVAREVLKLTKPSLFVETPEEAEDAKVKG